MAIVEIIEEQEIAAAWRFVAQRITDDGSLERHEMTLNWADYNLWCPAGEVPPSVVAEAVMGFIIDRDPEARLPDRFDAAMARRRWPAEADVVIPGLIRR